MNRIKELRLEKGKLQHWLAKEIGVSDSFISLIEAGKKMPSVENAKKIGEVFGVPWYSLYPQEEPNDTG